MCWWRKKSVMKQGQRMTKKMKMILNLEKGKGNSQKSRERTQKLIFETKVI